MLLLTYFNMQSRVNFSFPNKVNFGNLDYKSH